MQACNLRPKTRLQRLGKGSVTIQRDYCRTHRCLRFKILQSIKGLSFYLQAEPSDYLRRSTPKWTTETQSGVREKLGNYLRQLQVNVKRLKDLLD